MKVITILIVLTQLAWAAPDCETCLDPEQPLQGLLNPGLSASLQNLSDISACALPAVGGAVRHDQIGHTENKIPNNSQYVLRRPSEKSWTVEFGAQFAAVNGATAAQAAEMRTRVEQCFAQAAPAMLGPGGHQLRMTLRGASGASPAPPMLAINVMPSGRGNATNFSMEFTCATIVHEFLHHAGLCDEYPESNPSEVQNASSCRAIVPEGSIMSVSMQATYDDAVGLAGRCTLVPGSKWVTAPVEHLNIDMLPDANDIGRGLADRSIFENGWCTVGNFTPTTARPVINDYRIRFAEIPRGFEMDFPGRNVIPSQTAPIPSRLTCRCPAGNSTCLAKIATARGKFTEGYQAENRRFQCPANSLETSAAQVNMAVGTLRDERASGGYVEYRNPPRQNRSLLHPAHFSRILRGSCRELDSATLYDRCAQFAYRHSQPDNTPANCSTVPADCRDPLKYLGGPPVPR